MTYELTPQVDPLAPEVQQTLSTYPGADRYLLKLFRVFASSPRFLRKGTINLLDAESPLTLRERELVILRVCANFRCEYEWGVHIASFAGRAGFTDAQRLGTLSRRPAADCWTPEELTLLQAVDELCAQGALFPDTREAFQSRWDQAAQLEILALTGNYHTVAMVANVAALAPEAFAARFPAGQAGATDTDR